jgi:hypothetical protein
LFLLFWLFLIKVLGLSCEPYLDRLDLIMLFACLVWGFPSGYLIEFALAVAI